MRKKAILISLALFFIAAVGYYYISNKRPERTVMSCAKTDTTKNKPPDK